MAWEHRRRKQQGAKIFQGAKWLSSAFPMIFPSSCASATCGRDQTLWIQQRLRWQKGSCRCWTRCPRLTFAVVPRSSPSCYAALNLGGFLAIWINLKMYLSPELLEEVEAHLEDCGGDEEEVNSPVCNWNSTFTICFDILLHCLDLSVSA